MDFVLHPRHLLLIALAAWIDRQQQDVIEYEKVLNAKVEAGAKAGKFYRKLGKSFAELESYELCVRYLKKAIEFGYTTDKVFYRLGSCQGTLARKHNWEYQMTLAAEQTLLKVLSLNPHFSQAKLKLGLI